MSGITTATVWVCSKCGRVSHLDGAAQPQQVTLESCPAANPATADFSRHSLKPVIVVVPYG